MTETTDEWTIRSDEERMNVIYQEWEGDIRMFEEEIFTKAICLKCGNALNTWSKPILMSNPRSMVRILYCGVCE